jgi:hypothetical protein
VVTDADPVTTDAYCRACVETMQALLVRKDIVDMIGPFLLAMQKESWLTLLSRCFARGAVVQALKARLRQFADTIRMIAYPARLVPNLIAVEITANDRLWTQSASVQLQIVPELCDIAEFKGGFPAQSPNRQNIQLAAQANWEKQPTFTLRPVMPLNALATTGKDANALVLVVAFPGVVTRPLAITWRRLSRILTFLDDKNVGIDGVEPFELVPKGTIAVPGN